MELEDFSALRSQDKRVDIPLNGITYYAIPNPPAELILEATGSANSEDLRLVVRAAAGEQLAPEQMAKAAAVTATQTARAMEFLDQVLEPESAARWAHYMRRLPTSEDDGTDRDPTVAEMEEHAEHAITLRQCIAVFQALVGHYAGRPTEPPSSSPNGRGGRGGRSTAGARAKA